MKKATLLFVIIVSNSFLLMGQTDTINVMLDQNNFSVLGIRKNVSYSKTTSAKISLFDIKKMHDRFSYFFKNSDDPVLLVETKKIKITPLSEENVAIFKERFLNIIIVDDNNSKGKFSKENSKNIKILN